MAYTRYYPNGWNNGAAGGTPITPAALNHIEDGILGITPGNLGLAMEFNGTWTLANMYPTMSKVSVPGSALLWLSPSAAGLLSGGKVADYCTVVASRTNQSNWRFMAFTGASEVCTWTLSGWSGASATPTIGTVYRLTGTAI